MSGTSMINFGFQLAKNGLSDGENWKSVRFFLVKL